MNDKEFFERAVPVMLEKYPAPDRDTVIGHIRESAGEMTERRRSELPKRAVIIPVIIAAVLALTGAVIHEVYTIGYSMSDLVSELKAGRYYLETTDGYDTDCYIEVYGDNTLQFFGIEQKGDLGSGNYYDWNSAPVEYRLIDVIPFILLNDARDSLHEDEWEGGSGIGLQYEDGETLCTNVPVNEFPDAKDYTPEVYKETYEYHGIVWAHFVYEDKALNGQ